jgi:hypothetical protein
MSHPNVKKSSKPRPLQDTFNDLLYNIPHIILDNLYLGEKGSTPPLSSPKSLRSLR